MSKKHLNKSAVDKNGMKRRTIFELQHYSTDLEKRAFCMLCATRQYYRCFDRICSYTVYAHT